MRHSVKGNQSGFALAALIFFLTALPKTIAAIVAKARYSEPGAVNLVDLPFGAVGHRRADVITVARACCWNSCGGVERRAHKLYVEGRWT